MFLNNVEKIIASIVDALVFNKPFNDILIQAVEEHVAIQFLPGEPCRGLTKVVCRCADSGAYATYVIDAVTLGESIFYDDKDSVDRNARAYGWEACRSGVLKKSYKPSPDNPFNKHEWKQDILEEETNAEDSL